MPTGTDLALFIHELITLGRRQTVHYCHMEYEMAGRQRRAAG